MLVASPVCVFTIPLLGLHSIQSCCKDAGIDCRVFYPNLLYASHVSGTLHQEIFPGETYMWGERVFAPAVFNIRPPGEIPTGFDLEALQEKTSSWLNETAGQIVDTGFPIIGCSTTCGGLVPALAVLNAVKGINPSIVTVLGGPACDGEMAHGIQSLNVGVDYIFSGEGEITFPELAKRFMSGQFPRHPIVRGKEVQDLDTLHFPDFRDYLFQKELFYPADVDGKEVCLLPYETSRGCWYGKCSFCGLNGESNHFRSKSPDTVLGDLRALDREYDVSFVTMTDTMMPRRFFDSVIPALADEPPTFEIFFEIGAQLSLSQIQLLKRAGIRHLQPGIESLSSSLLERMDKPVTVMENIALLRYARAENVNLRWMLLYGLPGDRREEYEELLDVMELIRHLQPPEGVIAMKLCRNSKFHKTPRRYEINNLRPASFYLDVLPPDTDFDKISYYLDGDFNSGALEDNDIVNRLNRSVAKWRDAWALYKSLPLDLLLPALHVTRKGDGTYVLEDTRGLRGLPRRLEFDDEAAATLLTTRPLAQVAEPERFLESRLAMVSGSWFVPLATADPEILAGFESRRGQ